VSTGTEHRNALAQRNEALALELLEEHRVLVRAILPQHGGREVNTTGARKMEQAKQQR
jgi:hypothetical protein